MTAHTTQPPAESRAALVQGLGIETEKAESLLANKDWHPHKVYTVDLQDIIDGKKISDARQISWRYLIEEEGQTSFAAEVYHNGSPEKAHSFASINRGPFVQSTVDAIKKLEQDSDIKKGEYEIHVMRIPELYVMALWLRGINGSKDILIPIAPTYHAI